MHDYLLYSLVLLLGAIPLTAFVRRTSELDNIPAIGYTNPLLSWISAARFLVQGRTMVQEGFDKYPDSVFRVAQPDRWFILVSGPKLIEELRKASDEVLSMADAIQDGLELNRTFGPGIHNDPYHIPLIRSHLTRNLVAMTSDLHDEVEIAFKEAIVLSDGDEWTSVSAFDTVTGIICRVSNRAFVGLPLCSDPEYRKLMVGFAHTVIETMVIIKMFPPFLRDTARKLFSKVDKSVARAISYVQPLIEEHRRGMEQPNEEYQSKPETVFKWLVHGAEGDEASIRALTLRLIHVNFVALHTTSMSFTYLLYHLATMPEYVEPLRAEVEAVVHEYGWTKAALTKMYKLDSFIRESQRINGLGAVLMPRLVLQPFTFSDGTTLPVGATVGVASTSTHYSDRAYPNPSQFDGFRFSKLREAENAESVSKWRFVTTSPDYVAFGHGRHACPGRFFAATELQLMLAHILVNYDVKMAEGKLPATKWITSASMPDFKANVLFRKRQSA